MKQSVDRPLDSKPKYFSKLTSEQYIKKKAALHNGPPSKWRSTWWLLTAYSENLEKIEKAIQTKEFPEWIANIYGGLEIGEQTARQHHQIALQCVGQMRGKKIMEWLPGVHFECAVDWEAVKQYCLKLETAIGPKVSVSNDKAIEFMSCQKIHELLAAQLPDTGYPDYWARVNKIIELKPYLIGVLQNPALKASWNGTWHTWVRRGLVLPPPAVSSRRDTAQKESCRFGDECAGCILCA